MRCFYLDVFFFQTFVYILKLLRREIYFEIQYEKVVYAYMLIKYSMHNILSTMSKNRDVTLIILKLVAKTLIANQISI